MPRSHREDDFAETPGERLREEGNSGTVVRRERRTAGAAGDH